MIDVPQQQGNKFGKIGNKILAGFLLIVPIATTIWITLFLYDILTEWAGMILEHKTFESMNKVFGVETAVRIFSLFLILFVLYLIGSIAKHAIGKRIATILEHIILKIPMLNIIYTTIQQIRDALSNPHAGMFRKVVLFEYPRKGIYVIGFLTNENAGEWELKEHTGKDLISVFLPTTPNPTSGFLLFVPRKDCIFLKMGIAEGMRLVISGGAVAPNKINNNTFIQNSYQ